MIDKINAFAIWCLFFTFFSMDLSINAQQSDDVLFYVAGKPVGKSEFEYIYRKTNGSEATFSRESIEEYLDLYIKFKLKVQRARDMKLDTIQVLSRELEDYRRQLADTYLVDKEVTDKLVQEVYDRMKRERRVAHILFRYKNNATAADSVETRDRATRVLEILRKKGDFERLAAGQSDDQATKNNGGDLGYLSAMLPSGFHKVEDVIYETPIGSFSGLVESPMGIHIFKILDERPARGEVEVAHILIRDPENAPVAGAEQKIIEIWTELNDGASFESLAQRYSEDLTTASKGGYLGFFGINRYEQSFEDAAFALKNDGDYSTPFRTRAGWHIVKRISQKGLDLLPKIKNRLQSQIKQDIRFEHAKRQMINRIKEEGGFTEDLVVLGQYIDQLDNDFLSYKWKGIPMQRATLIKMAGNYEITTEDFTEFLLRNQRKRLQMSRDSNVVETAQILYSEFVDENMIKYAEKQLEQKYPEYKALMREYEEGILLFEAAKISVWDRASQDTIGLEKFLKNNRSRYMWDERAEYIRYRIHTQDAKLANKIARYIQKNPPAKVVKKFNSKGDLVTYETKLVEKSQKSEIKDMAWQAGSVTPIAAHKSEPYFEIAKIERIIPPTPKALHETRGPLIADYQDFLEKEWVRELKETYEVRINKEVLNSMIKS